MEHIYEVLIVGAGPAGLSGAMWLGRCARNVLLCGAGQPRNANSRGLHGFLTRDGSLPGDLIKSARAELKTYPSVEVRDIAVINAERRGDNFKAKLIDGTFILARKLLITTGVIDTMPSISNVETFYGQSVFHCPYCDGWEYRGQPVAVYAQGNAALELSRKMTRWTRDIVICSNGPSGISDVERIGLTPLGISIREDKIAKLEGPDGMMEYIVFENGERLPRNAIFFSTKKYQHSELAAQLGCEFSEKGCVQTGKFESTCQRGVYVAGDASGSMQLAIVAASEGAMAAIALNEELLKEELEPLAPRTECAHQTNR